MSDLTSKEKVEAVVEWLGNNARGITLLDWQAKADVLLDAAREIERLQAGVKFLENVNAQLGESLRTVQREYTSYWEWAQEKIERASAEPPAAPGPMTCLSCGGEAQSSPSTPIPAPLLSEVLEFLRMRRPAGWYRDQLIARLEAARSEPPTAVDPIEAKARQMFNTAHNINEGAWDRQTEEQREAWRAVIRNQQWCMDAARREEAAGDPDITVLPALTKEAAPPDAGRIAARARMEGYNSGWAAHAKATQPTLVSLPMDEVSLTTLLIETARDSGFQDPQWRALFYQQGPYDITVPCFTLKKFCRLLLEKIQPTSTKEEPR